MGQKASPRHAGDGPSSERTVDLPVSALESHETRVRDARKTPLLPLLSAPLRFWPEVFLFRSFLLCGFSAPWAQARTPPRHFHLAAPTSAPRTLRCAFSACSLPLPSSPSLRPPPRRAADPAKHNCRADLGKSGQISPGTWDAGRMQSTSSRHVTLRSIDRSITVNPGTKTAKTPCLQMLQSLKTFRPGPSCGSCA